MVWRWGLRYNVISLNHLDILLWVWLGLELAEFDSPRQLAFQHDHLISNAQPIINKPCDASFTC